MFSLAFITFHTRDVVRLFPKRKKNFVRTFLFEVQTRVSLPWDIFDAITLSVIYVCVCVYIYMYVFMYIYIYIWKTGIRINFFLLFPYHSLFLYILDYKRRFIATTVPWVDICVHIYAYYIYICIHIYPLF